MRSIDSLSSSLRRRRPATGSLAVVAVALMAGTAPVHGQAAAPFRETDRVPPVPALMAATASSLSDATQRYSTDRSALMRRYDLPFSTVRRERLRDFYTSWQSLLRDVPFDELDQESRVDHVLLGSEAAYMLGGLQFRALHGELVGTGRMTDREFHDRILQGGTMPVEMVRALLLDVPLERNYTPRWRFGG